MSKEVTVPQGTVLHILAGPIVGGVQQVNTIPNPDVAAGGSYLAFMNNDSYNALEVGFKRRLSQGLQFQVNYTWSKDEDFISGYSADDSGMTNVDLKPYNFFDPSMDWGPSGYQQNEQDQYQRRLPVAIWKSRQAFPG